VRLGPGPTQPAAPKPCRLNESQVRRIQSTFWYVDDLLKSVEALAHADPSPFSRERSDLTGDEARLLLSFVGLARKRMLAALDRLGIPRPQQNLSARRSVSTALQFGEMSLSELNSRALRGFGEVDPEAGEEITALAADLQALMQRGAALLKEEQDGGLVERLAALPGPAGEILRHLLATSSAHGLTEMRPLIAAAAERASGTTLDVGVFGRVSSGKSSLINALVGEPVLPVGATPVTAVPLRVSRGPHSAEVRFRDAPVQRVPLTELPSFATEEKNPQNVRGVRSIEVTVPGAPEGLRLLDTPGVGSLTSAGSAQAFAWLPRCDFGLVLVAAGTPLGRDETALLSGLRHAGIACCAVLSKADLLGDADIEQARDYILAELRPMLGPEEAVEVRPVSTRPPIMTGLDALRSEVLTPLARDHVRSAIDALRARLRRLVALAAAGMNGGASATDTAAVDLEKRRGAASEALGKMTDRLAGSAKAVLEGAAAAVAVCWSRGEDGAAAARSAILSAAGGALAAARQGVDAARSRGADGAEADGRRLPPLFDPEFLDAIKALPPPWLAPGAFRRSRAQGAVEPLLPFLDQALARYASRLRAWGEGALRELRPATEAPTEADRETPELAGLGTLIARVGVLEATPFPATAQTSRDAFQGSIDHKQETTGGSSC
jgi:Dynamin family